MAENKIPLAVINRIAKAAGAQRVSSDCAAMIQEVAVDFIEDLAGKAVAAANHAGRKTVKGSDVKAVMKMS